MSNDERDVPEEGVSARQNAQDKLATIQRQQRRRGRRGAVIGAVVAVVAIVAIAGTGYALINKDEADEQAGPAGSVAPGVQLGQVKTYNNLSQEHITSGYKYAQEPPAGGAHHPAWANCGIYDKEIKPQHAVHSLEHGAVWITYRSSVPKAQVDALKQKVNRQQGYMLLSVDNKQGAPIVLTAWGKQLHVRTPGDPSVDTFISDFWKGPQTPEPGASCEGAYDPNTDQIAGGM